MDPITLASATLANLAAYAVKGVNAAASEGSATYSEKKSKISLL